MQHFGEPISYSIHENGIDASLVVGRIIPQQHETVMKNQILYGANYELKLRKEKDIWRITYFSYNPGCFTQTKKIK